MANANKVILIGRLTRDVELKHTPGGMQIGDIGFVVNNRKKAQDGTYQESPVFIEVKAFGRTAELAAEYLSKGRMAYIEGRLEFDQWEDKNTGQKRSKLYVVADNIQFLDGGKKGGGEESEDSDNPF